MLLKSQELNLNKKDFFKVGLLSMIPWGISAVFMVLWGAHSDKTGERRWHFQFVHHGMWDMDIPCAPILADVVVGGMGVWPATIGARSRDSVVHHVKEGR